MQPFDIVYPKDPALKLVTLKVKGGSPVVKSLLENFRNLSIEQVALSSSWYSKFGSFTDSLGKPHSLGRDLSWSLLHFKEHVDPVLHNDIESRLQSFNKEEQGGPLYFILLMDEIVTSNEQSLAALEGTVKIYNIANDGKDDFPACIKLLKAVTRSIVAMRADGSNRNAFSDLFVVAIIGVLQTTSVQPFNDKMKQFHASIELERFRNKSSFNTPTMLNDIYSFALSVHTEMFNIGTWQQALLSKPKSGFTTTVMGLTAGLDWVNRYWNCELQDCNVHKCLKSPDKERIARNKLAWQQFNNKVPNSNNNNGNKRKKPVPHQWRPPTDDENNKRVIFGKPYTWNGKNSWIKDNTPDSGLESPADIASAAAIAILGQKNAAAAIAAAAMAGKPTTFPTSVAGGDDATALTFLTQDQLSEMARFQANMDNLGTKVSQMTSYLGGLNNKE